MSADVDRLQIEFESAVDLDNWLAANHRQRESIWLIRWKTSSGRATLDYNDIVDVCICHGWIDSIVRSLDDERSMLRLSPRRPESHWSAANKRRVERLAAERRLKPAGKRAIAEARENGAWAAIGDVEKLVVPNDLVTALKQFPDALRFFSGFADSSKRDIIGWINAAESGVMREQRIVETARCASENRETAYCGERDSDSPDPA